MVKKGLIFLSLFLTVMASPAAMPASAAAETDALAIVDATQSLSPAELQAFAAKVEQTFRQVRQWWSADPRTDQFGWIVVEFTEPLARTHSSVFLWRQGQGRPQRVVRVFGAAEAPQQLAHKLTSALYPNPDKLIRNMMGEASEQRFGNPLSFPGCGFAKESWVLALQQSGRYLSLAGIGTEHEEWGMAIVRNVPQVVDRGKQQACYSEVGAFGDYLIDRYGREAMKTFNARSRQRPRPWQEAFGAPLAQLEAQWLEALAAKADRQEAALLARWLDENPQTACFAAQRHCARR
jgi:hypothetical protein